MRRGMGYIEKERFFRFVRVNELDRFACDGFCVEEITFGLDVMISFGKRKRIPLIAGGDDRSEKLVEASLKGPVVFRSVFCEIVTDMPFSTHVGRVSRLFERFGDRHTVAIQIPSVARLAVVVSSHKPKTSPVRVEPRKQRGTGRTTTTTVVKLAEAQAATREYVKIRSINLPAIATDVRVAHVIDHDDDNIRPLLRKPCCTRHEKKKREQHSAFFLTLHNMNSAARYREMGILLSCMSLRLLS